MKASTIWKMFFAFLLASVGLYIFFKDVDISNLWGELKSTSIISIFGACFFLILSLYLRALRWNIILPTTEKTHKKFLFGNVCIGFMVNNILPARIGEITRALILWKKNKYPISICIGTLFIERLIDAIVFLSFFVIPVFILPQCANLIVYAQFALAIIIVITISTIFYTTFQSATVKFGTFLVSKFPEKFQTKLTQIGNELVLTLGWLYSLKRMVTIFSLSIFIGLCFSLIIILLAGKTVIPFGIVEGMFVQAYAAFGSAIPLSPGYIGTQHAVMLQGLNVLSMDGDKARALIILYHGLCYIVINVLGLYFLFRIKLTFKDIFSAKKRLIENPDV